MEVFGETRYEWAPEGKWKEWKAGCGCYLNILDSLQLLCNNSTRLLTRLDGRLHIEIVPDGFDAMNKHYLIVSFKLLNYKALLARELYRNVVVACADVPTTSDIEVVRAALFAFFAHLHDISKRRIHVFWPVSSTPRALPLPNTATAAEATDVIFRCDDNSNAEDESADEEVPIEFWLGGDLEMQRIFMGIYPKKYTHLCPVCEAVRKTQDATTTAKQRTTTDPLSEATGKTSNAILEWIETHRRVPCCLHLRMSLGRILARKIIDLAEAKAQAKEEAGELIGKTKKQRLDNEVKSLFAQLGAWACVHRMRCHFEKGRPNKGKFGVNGRDAAKLFKYWDTLGNIFGASWEPFATTVKPVADIHSAVRLLQKFHRVPDEKWYDMLRSLPVRVSAFSVAFNRSIDVVPYLHVLEIEIPRLWKRGGELDRLGLGLGAFSADMNESCVGKAKKTLLTKTNRGGGTQKLNLPAAIIGEFALCVVTHVEHHLMPPTHLRNTS